MKKLISLISTEGKTVEQIKKEALDAYQKYQQKTKEGIKNLSKNDFVETIFNLIRSSKRGMPAHFTSNGERTQSFCIDFDGIDVKDEYQMASVAYIEVSDYVKTEDNLTKEQYMTVVRCGEDIMISSYISQKLGRTDLIDTIVNKIIKEISQSWPVELKVSEVYKLQSVKKWFKHCQEYGIETAKKSLISK